MRDIHGMYMDVGSQVVTHPAPDSLCSHGFIGTIRKFRRETNGLLLAAVEDQDGNVFEFKKEELELECE